MQQANCLKASNSKFQRAGKQMKGVLCIKNYYTSTLILIFTVCSLIFYSFADSLNEQDKKIITQVEHQYSGVAAQRVISWFQFLYQNDNKTINDVTKLKRVNDLLNRETFISDQELWGMTDYWASPIEFIAVNGGDCEDFTIAKYYTLRLIGIDDNKLRLIYVKATRLNQFHMVLAYYASVTAMPLILDNLDKTIKPANERTDLVPVYSFNASNLWIMRTPGQSQLAGNASRLGSWNDLRTRYQNNVLRKPILNLGY